MSTGSRGEGGDEVVEWLDTLDLVTLRRTVGQRALDLAMSSGLVYVLPPERDGHMVRAALRHEASRARRADEPDVFRVALWEARGGAGLAGECSRCATHFGPCAHMATVAIDIGADEGLRDALRDAVDTRVFAERAPAKRYALRAAATFEGALARWTSTAADGTRVEIAATPFDEVEPTARAYAPPGPPGGASLVITVRRVGERRLLAPREIKGAVPLLARDRRVLAHTSDRTARKAVYAVGVDASLTLEAMRAHGGIYAAGYTKGRLDFRPATVRPKVSFDKTSGATSGVDALNASWAIDGSGEAIAFEVSAFIDGPFPYVWTRAGAIYRVAPDVDPELARHFVAAPVLLVPAGRLRDAGARLVRATRGRGITLPPNDVFGLPSVETPKFVLRLAGEPLDVAGQLVAIYRSREMTLYGGESAPEDGRDLPSEGRARALVEQVGLIVEGEDEDDARTREEALPRVAASGERAVAFWQSGLAELRAASEPPIEVVLTPRLAQVRVGEEIRGRVHVALEGGWLDTRVEFTARELAVELGEIRAALHRKQRWVSLADGTLARITASIEALADEAATVLGDGAAAKLGAHQLGRLDRWIAENDGTVDDAVEAFRRRLRALAVATEPDIPDGLTGSLRPYQRQGLAWLQFLEALGAGGILADDMGLGKTITTLAFLLRRQELAGRVPSLVVCPTSVAPTWLREAARFTPTLRVTLLHGASRDTRDIATSDIVVTTYALLRRDLDALLAVRFRCAILDEAQNIKNPESATARAAFRLDADMRLALSGTPIENRLRELWSLASFANPGILGTTRLFEARFERPLIANRASPIGAELRAIVRPFLLRRTKAEVLTELPPKTEIDRVVLLRREDKRMYDALAHTLRASIAKKLEKRTLAQSSLSVFAALTRLRQMACDPRLVDGRVDGERSAKREAFREVVRELVAEGRRALVFSQFVQLLTLWRRDLEAEGVAYEYLDGSTTDRQTVVDRFQQGNAPLFLISLKAGGAGLNLTAADTVVHCDPWWNPAVEDQATDRAHRIGQDKPVTVIRLVARGTIEEKMLALKDKKRELTRLALEGNSAGRAGALDGLTPDDVDALLGDADADATDADDASDDEADTLAPSASRRPMSDVLATDTEVLDPEFDEVTSLARRWLLETGRLETDLARVVEIPIPFAARIARGEPFPCSRAVAARIRARIDAW